MDEFTYRPFQKLRELLKELPQKAPIKDSMYGIDDEELFRKAMKDVREIKEFREIPYNSPQRRLKPKSTSNDIQTVRILEEIVKGRKSIELSKTQEYTEWVNPDFPADLPRLLHQGKYSVQDFIDLHGYTTEEARIVVEDFLKQSRLKGFRCVKIIHGRGLRSARGPVLKEAVLGWLRRDFRKWVIAYATARPFDGGLGATYILLKQ